MKQGTPFIGEVSNPYFSPKIIKGLVVLRRVEAAPAFPILGRFGDLIVSLEGIALEQAKLAQKLIQEQETKA